MYDNSELRPRLVKVTSDAESVKDLDRRVGGITFGWVGLSQKIHIVRDRVWTDRMFAHVFMHEVLHVLGAEHVKDERAVMYEQTDFTHTATVLTAADRAALSAARNLTASRR